MTFEALLQMVSCGVHYWQACKINNTAQISFMLTMGFTSWLMLARGSEDTGGKKDMSKDSLPATRPYQSHVQGQGSAKICDFFHNGHMFYGFIKWQMGEEWAPASQNEMDNEKTFTCVEPVKGQTKKPQPLYQVILVPFSQRRKRKDAIKRICVVFCVYRLDLI